MGLNSVNFGAEYVNTDNVTADKSQNNGRDNLEAEAHMLDGQLDNKENTFINFTTKDGSKYEAFRSKDTTRVYYGFRKNGEANQAWQDLKAAPVELKQTLDQAHSNKLQSIKQMDGYENYKLNQKALGEIQDLNDLHHDDKGQLKTNLDTSRQEALAKIKNLGTNPRDLEVIKRDHPEISSDLIINRFNKVAGIIGEDKLASTKQNLENELTKLGAKTTEHGYSFSEVKDKGALSGSLNKANTAIDTKINEIRNAAQRLNVSEQAEHSKIQEELKTTINKLEAKHASDPEFQKLQELYKELSGSLNQDQGKYSLTQLKAFQGYIGSEGWSDKVKTSVDDSSKETNKIITATFNNNEADKLIATIKTMSDGSRLEAKRTDGSIINYYTKIDGEVYRDSGSLLAEKLNPNNNYVPFQSDNRFIIQGKDDSYQAYTIDTRHANSRIIPYYDEVTKSNKVFVVNEDSGNKKYQELQPIEVDRANVAAYKIKDGLEDKYYMFQANSATKNSLWELKLPAGRYGLISAAQSSYRLDGTRAVTVGGLNFHFDHNANLIGLMAKPSRSEGLSYELNQLEEARKQVFEVH